MARTKSDDILRRQKRITARFTGTEYETLKEKADALHKPIATFIHDATLGGKIELCYELSPSMPELAAIANSLGKTASNLNQIARHLNEGGCVTEGIETDIRQGIREIFSLRGELNLLKTTLNG